MTENERATELLMECLEWSHAKNHSYMSYNMGLPPVLENGIADFLNQPRHYEWRDYLPIRATEKTEDTKST